MAFGTFSDLRPYQAAVARPVQNPLDALIQGFQQGQAIQQLPETIQQDALNKQLQQAIVQSKLNQIQTGTVENVGGRLVRYNPSTGQTDVILDSVSSPETQQFVGLVNNQPLMVGSKTGNFSIGKLPQGVDLTGGISPKVTPAETLTTVNTDQGLVKTGNRSTTATPLTMGGVQVVKPTAPVNVKQITDANGFLYTQPLTGGAPTPVLNEDGTHFNAGVANKVFTSDQGVFTVPTKSAGTPTPTALTTTGEAGTPTVQLTKTPAKGDLVEKLAKDVQSNKAYQAFRTVNDATEGLKATLDYANTNPQDQTGIKSSAVDAFNKIINPNSVVRQQAFSQTTSGQSLINKFNNFVNGLGTGQTITPIQIKAMVDLAAQYQEGSRKSAEKELSVIKHRGDKAGVDPEDYIPGIFNKVNPQEMITIIDSTGSPHQIFKINLSEAQKRDPGLRVQ